MRGVKTSLRQQLDYARSHPRTKAFIKTVLESALVSVRGARRHHPLEHASAGDASRIYAQRVYERASKDFRELSDPHSADQWELRCLLARVKRALAATSA